MTVLVSDSFNRANANTLGSTDSYNGGTSYPWTILSGTTAVGIYNNSARGYGSANTDQEAYVNPNVSDCSISINPTITDSNTIWILARVSSESNRIIAELSSSGSLKVSKFVNSTRTNLISQTVNYVAGQTLKLTLNGSTITVYYNGVQVGTVTETFNQTITNHGIGFWNTQVNTIDNFVIEDLSTGTTYIGSGTSQGTSSLSDTSKEVSSASGSVQSSSTLTTLESKSYSTNGSTSATSVVSSVGNVIYVDFGNSNGQSNLTTSEQLVSPTGTTYSETGQSNGTANLTTSESYVYKSNGSSNVISSVSSNDSVINKANSSTIKGISSLSTSETIITHTGTNYSASGQSNGLSHISVHETCIANAIGNINGISSLTSVFQYMYGLTDKGSFTYSNLTDRGHFIFGNETEKGNFVFNLISQDRYISKFQIVGTIHLNGKRQLNSYLEGKRQLNTNLKGVIE